MESRTTSTASIIRSPTPFANSDFTYKVIIVGSSSVGKTCLIERAVNDRFNEVYDTTIVSDLITMYFTIDQRKVKVQFWDTCGLEQYRSINTSYYKGSDIALILYDVTKEKSLHACSKLIDDIKDNCKEDTLLYLVGTKNDLLDKSVSKEMAKELVEKEEIGKVFEISSKTGEGIIELLEEITRKQILSSLSKIRVNSDNSRSNSFLISRRRSTTTKQCCCN